MTDFMAAVWLFAPQS